MLQFDFDAELNKTSRLDQLSSDEQAEFKRGVACSTMMGCSLFAIATYGYLSNLYRSEFNFEVMIPWHFAAATIYFAGQLTDFSSTQFVKLFGGIEVNRHYSENPSATELIGGVAENARDLFKASLIPPLGIAMGAASFMAAIDNIAQLRKLL